MFGLTVCPVRAAGQRHVTFTYDVDLQNITPSADTIDLWLPIPPGTAEQRVLALKVSAPIKGEVLTEHKYGNHVWHGRFTRPASGRIHVSQAAELLLRERRGSTPINPSHVFPPDAATTYLQPNRLVPLTDRFAQIARKAMGMKRTPMSRAHALYDYVLNHMTYDKSGANWGRGDANYACDIGKGNCSDFHSFFIALSRSAHIPARFWIGFPLPAARGRGEVSGYHCWAEFFVHGVGWTPVDISEADKHPDKVAYYFGHLDENRIVFSLGRDLVLPPSQQGPPLNFFIYPYAEVDGKPWKGITYRFTFEDLPLGPTSKADGDHRDGEASHGH